LDKLKADETFLAKSYDDTGFALDDAWSFWFASDTNNNTVLKRDHNEIVEKAVAPLEYTVSGDDQLENDEEYDPLANAEVLERQTKKPRLF
jgi:hypothetical protein